MAWVMVGQCVAFALLFSIATWVRARRSGRTPAQSAKMWGTAWMTGGFLFAASLLAAAIIIEAGPIPRPTRYVVFTLAGGAMILSLAGGFIHGWVLRRLDRLGPDPDYGDLDEIPPPAADADSADRTH
jgi:hypothetical protein